MISKIIAALLIVGLLLGGFWVYNNQQDKITDLEGQLTELRKNKNETITTVQTSNTFTSNKGVKVTVYMPEKNGLVTSSQAVLGQVPGNWSFEASFPVILEDANGKIIVQAPAQVLGDWQTDKLVPFSVKLTFANPQTSTGTLVLKKDNPSGLAVNDDEVRIPVKFQ